MMQKLESVARSAMWATLAIVAAILVIVTSAVPVSAAPPSIPGRPILPVVPLPLPVTLSITATPNHVGAGQTATIVAVAQGVKRAWLDGQPIIGGAVHKQVKPCGDTVYKLEATLPDGSRQERTVKVLVSGSCQEDNIGLPQALAP